MAGFRGKEVAVKSFVKSECFKGRVRGPGSLAQSHFAQSRFAQSQDRVEQDPAPSRAPTALELLLIFIPQACPHHRQLEYLPTGMELLLSKEICAL